MLPASKIKVAFYCFFPGGGIGQYTHELLTQLMCLESLTVSLYCPPNFEWLDKAKYETHPVLFDFVEPATHPQNEVPDGAVDKSESIPTSCD